MKQFVIGYDITDPKLTQRFINKCNILRFRYNIVFFLFEGTKEQLRKPLHR